MGGCERERERETQRVCVPSPCIHISFGFLYNGVDKQMLDHASSADGSFLSVSQVNGTITVR